MDLLIITLIMMACLQLFMNIRKSRKIGHIGELSGVNELMDYIDHNELTLTNDMGKNALMIACSKHFYTKPGEYGYEDVVKSAINRGINLNIRNPKDGKTPLMYALNNRDSAVSANLLIDAGADIDIEDHRGRIALFDSVS
ncbi:MAG: ankyrin repeat domain-containing protein, partial [Clostridia bacterium]|nr:ankyrin repeat domain-containing protein [Clostridia bacterium]